MCHDGAAQITFRSLGQVKPTNTHTESIFALCLFGVARYHVWAWHAATEHGGLRLCGMCRHAPHQMAKCRAKVSIRSLLCCSRAVFQL